MTRVKICGITSLKDAEYAVRCGADALGFVFAKSPRQIQVRDAKKIIGSLGPWVACVGVFVNEKAKEILRIASECRLSAAQLHGDEGPDTLRSLASLRVIKAFRVGGDFDVKVFRKFPADAFLFDAKMEGAAGGTGKRFDWNILKGRLPRGPFIISGGLDPKNVREAVRFFRPYGVDVSSGVESAPGKKDPRLVKEFIQNAKNN